MEDNYSIIFSFDFKQNSLLIKDNQNIITEEQYYGLSTMKEQEFLKILKNSISLSLQKYKKTKNLSKD